MGKWRACACCAVHIAALTTIPKAVFRLKLLLFCILLLRNLFMPLRLPMTDCQMHHETPIVTSMPVRRPSTTPNRVSNIQSPRLTTFVTDPARTSHYSQKLAILVGVPVCAGAGREHDLVDVDCWACTFCVNWVHPYCTRKGAGCLAALRIWFVGLRDDC
jgi:hypothetical protein